MEPAKKNKRKDAFWRACRYLGPHRRIVCISIVCAFVVGVAFTSGLGTMLPIMQVLINGETIPDWANRKVAEQRLGVNLAEGSYEVRIARVIDGEAARKGLRAGQAIWLPPGSAATTKRASEADARAEASHLLEILADPARSSVKVAVEGPSQRSGYALTLNLRPVSPHLALAHDVAMKMPRDKIKAIGTVLVLLLLLSLFGNVVRFFQEYLSEKAAISAVRDIRRRVYDHTLHLRLSFFSQNGTSDVTSRLTQDAQGLQDGLKNILGSSVQEMMKAAMAMGLAVYASWQLTLFIVVFAPLMLAIIKKFGKKVRRSAKAALQNSSQMLGQIESSLGGVRVVKATNAEPFERRRFRGILGSLVHEQLRIAKLEAFNTPMLEMLTLVVVCCIVLYASYLVLEVGSVEKTTFFLVMACLMGIGESLRKISKINNLLQKSNAAATRLFEIADLDSERARAPRGPDTRPGAHASERPRLVLPPIQEEVRFENITFTYPGAQGPALRDVSLTVRRGQCVAVVGRNGSGKTTLLSLLPRFYDPQQGRILVDGVDIRNVTLNSLRRQIGIVTQDSVIFPGTIAQNIAYAIPQVGRDQIIAAARQAFAHDFIQEKPKGYDTLVGEHGSQLSGGQKQRLCIARAILRATPILILDEATSQVDAESEHLIQQAIESLMHQRTTFVIAHRFSTILSADQIIVMDRGQIVGSGSHEQLMRTCPTYLQLYERQSFALPSAELDGATSVSQH